MESYATQPGSATTVSAVEGSESPAVVAATQLTEKLSTLVEKLTERVERLELNQVSDTSRNRELPDHYEARGRGRGGSRGRGMSPKYSVLELWIDRTHCQKLQAEPGN